MKRNLQRALSCLLLCTLLMTGLTVPASAARFRDVPAGHWAAASIQRCVDLGLFQGRTATAFGMGMPMSRGAFAVVLCRFFGWDTPKVESPSFTDVPADDWYAPAVEAARAHGAITLQASEFRPGIPITREDLAVILVRALGLSPVAGLAQDLESPFHDVDTNKGYLTMAYDLGLVNGISTHQFAPHRPATREQTAVILMRLYDKLHAQAPGKVGIATSAKDLPNLADFEAVAIPAAKLFQSDTVKVVSDMTAGKVKGIRAAAEEAHVKQLLAVSVLEELAEQITAPAEVAEEIAAAVREDGYDGLFLDLRDIRSDETVEIVKQLSQEVDLALGELPFYLAMMAPVWHGEPVAAFDYAALGKFADRLVLQPASYEDATGAYPVAPAEPLEELYYSLRLLKDSGKLSLLLTTTGTVWNGTSKTDTVTGLETDALLADKYTKTYAAQRYGCSYMETKRHLRSVLVWYPDELSIARRAALMQLFGVDQVVLSELSGVSESVLAGLR